jgi:hypothetical protein
MHGQSPSAQKAHVHLRFVANQGNAEPSPRLLLSSMCTSRPAAMRDVRVGAVVCPRRIRAGRRYAAALGARQPPPCRPSLEGQAQGTPRTLQKLQHSQVLHPSHAPVVHAGQFQPRSQVRVVLSRLCPAHDRQHSAGAGIFVLAEAQAERAVLREDSLEALLAPHVASQ